MNKRFTTGLWTGIATVAVLSGCHSPPPPTVQQPELQIQAINAEEQARLQASGQAIGAGMLAAIQSGDYAAFAAHLLPELAERVTAENFAIFRQTLQQEQGSIVNSAFLTEMMQPPWVTMIWKVTFEHTGENATIQKHDALFKVIFGKVDETYKVMGFTIIP